MYLTLRLSPSLQKSINDKFELTLEGDTIGQCIEQGKKNFTGLSELLFKEEKLNPQILLFYNNTLIHEDDFAIKIKPDDVLDIIPAIEAG